MIYLDTSVVVAYYCPEPISKRAEAIVRGRRAVFISDLTEVEFFSAVSRKLRTREIQLDDALAIRNHFVAHLNEGVYRRASLGPHHIQAAREFISAFTTPLRTLDALHLAIAAFDKLQLVTADEAFATAAKALSIKATFVTS